MKIFDKLTDYITGISKVVTSIWTDTFLQCIRISAIQHFMNIRAKKAEKVRRIAEYFCVFKSILRE